MAVEFENLKFELLGHSSVRISNSEKVIYIDPWGDVIDSSMNDADLVIVTHDDFDHYDPAGIEKVSNSDTTVLIYESVDTSDLNRDLEKIGIGEKKHIESIEIETVPAYNLEDGPHVDTDGEPYHAEGEVMGVILTIDDLKVYYPSDTDFLPSHEEITANVFLPPIGGHYTMNRSEAAEFAKSTEADLVLPLHYDTFEAIEADEERFKAQIEGQGQNVRIF